MALIDGTAGAKISVVGGGKAEAKSGLVCLVDHYDDVTDVSRDARATPQPQLQSKTTAHPQAALPSRAFQSLPARDDVATTVVTSTDWPTSRDIPAVSPSSSSALTSSCAATTTTAAAAAAAGNDQPTDLLFLGQRIVVGLCNSRGGRVGEHFINLEVVKTFI